MGDDALSLEFWGMVSFRRRYTEINWGPLIIPNDLHVEMMLCNTGYEIPETVLMPETDCEPGIVRGQTKNVEFCLFWIDAEIFFLQISPVPDFLENIVDKLLRRRSWSFIRFWILPDFFSGFNRIDKETGEILAVLSRSFQPRRLLSCYRSGSGSCSPVQEDDSTRLCT